jgi:outer membrane protein assembly factor BamC
MTKFSRTALLVALALASAACTTVFTSKKVDYGNATASKLPPLEVPPDLTKPKPEDRFTIPDGKATSYSEYTQERNAPARTGNTDVLPTFDKAHIERAGAQRWLVVPGSPEQLWPQVKEFWLALGFTLPVDIPAAGVMETDWKENRAKIPEDGIRKYVGMVFDSLWSTGERDKFRTRLERGTEPGTTEIYVSHRGVEEIVDGQAFSSTPGKTGWQPRQPDPELEAEMLGRMLVKFGVQEDRAKTMVADNGKPNRARIVDNADGTGMLEVTEPFDRAWRRVGLALDRVGFTVEDRDRAKGLYFVRYVDPEIDQRQAEKGFFKRLFSSSADKKAERYRVAVKDEKDTSQVQVQSNEGVPDKSPTGKKILALLQDQLR